MKRIFTTLIMLIVVQFLANAQVDTINATNKKLQKGQLREGKAVYLVYMVDSATSKRTVGDLWQREIRFTTSKNKPTVTFTWHWLHADTLLATIVNVCDRETLAPIYHSANYKTRGIFAYDYRNGEMLPSDTITNNMAVKKGKVALPIPVISWEQDLETYPLLPIKKVGQQFDVSFFDPNEKVPSYHRYEVVGKEELQLNTDTKVKCWLLKIQYSPDSYATFWLTEKSKEVVKMKEYFKGKYRFKVRQY